MGAVGTLHIFIRYSSLQSTGTGIVLSFVTIYGHGLCQSAGGYRGTQYSLVLSGGHIFTIVAGSVVGPDS
jgi:hypothetical protein